MRVRRYTVYRYAPAKRAEWLVYDGLDRYAVASCPTRRNAALVRDALNAFNDQGDVILTDPDGTTA